MNIKKFSRLLGMVLAIVALITSSGTPAAFAAASSTVIMGAVQVVHPANIGVSNITTDKTSYKAGDTVTGTFTMVNHSGFTVTGISYRVELGSDYTDIGPGVKYTNTFIDAGDRQGSLSLATGETRQVPFSYQIPVSISGDKLAIAIHLYLSDGSTVGLNSGDYISVSGGTEQIVVKAVTLLLSDGKVYALTTGPTIYSDEEPRDAYLTMTVTNTTNASITLVPALSVYLQSDISTAKDYPVPTTILEAGKSQDLKIELPNMVGAPGVYFGELLLKDDKGNQLATRIGVRYIVGGDIAIVRSISADKTILTQGQNFNFSADLFGRSLDIGSLGTEKDNSDNGSGHADIAIYNESGVLVASSSEPFNAYGETNIEKQYAAASPATALRAEVIVWSASGKMLLDYKQNLSADYDAQAAAALAAESSSESQLEIMIGFGLLLLVLVIILIVMFKKRISAKSALMSFAILIGILSFGSSKVWAETIQNYSSPGDCTGDDLANLQPSIQINDPADGETVEPGQLIYVNGTIGYGGCTNSPTNMSITVTGPGGDSQSLPNVGTTPDLGVHDAFRDTTPYSAGPFRAPLAAGDYTIVVNADNVIDADVPDDSGKIIHYFCSAGQIATIVIHVVSTSLGDTPGTPGGCGADEFYCDATGACMADGSQGLCNQTSSYNPFQMNPNFPGLEGPVSLKGKLKPQPLIAEPGDSCIIDWSQDFISYDQRTICQFTSSSHALQYFSPGDPAAPTSTSLDDLQNDTTYAMNCSESDGLTPSSTDTGVCRVNFNYKEIN